MAKGSSPSSTPRSVCSTTERIASVPAYGPMFEAAFGSRTVTLRRVGHEPFKQAANGARHGEHRAAHQHEEATA